MQVEALDHVNIETDDVDRSAEFYEHVIGLKPGRRPEFDRPGHWMYIGDHPIVHIIERHPDNAMLTGSKDAAISHFSMRIKDFEDAQTRLDSFKIKYRRNDVAGSTMRQLFFDDPDGVLVELIHIPDGAR
ncbi:MAG: VOC family protein [Rhodospirillales bacterium]|nr:VOC family protein [Rhodospirillales bacterium]